MDKLYCRDWMTVGLFCPCAYGFCTKKHYEFDKIPHQDHRNKIIKHVEETKGVAFNKERVRTLPEDKKKLLEDPASFACK